MCQKTMLKRSRYTDGEFLLGEMGTEILGIGQGNALTANQTIGLVDQGYWIGDSISSGLMGLAYPALESGYQYPDMNYTSVMPNL